MTSCGAFGPQLAATGRWTRAARLLLDRGAARTTGPTLTPREREVLHLLSEGLANKLIARRLGISERTVKAHLTRIYEQLGVSDRTQAALWALEHATTPAAGELPVKT